MCRYILCFLTGIALLSSCSQGTIAEDTIADQVVNQQWLGTIALSDTIPLNFNFTLSSSDSLSFQFVITNAGNVVDAKMIALGADSFKVEVPVFANYLLLSKTDSTMEGVYVNPDADDYQLPFKAKLSSESRYPLAAVSEELLGTYRLDFSPNTEEERSALAYLSIKGDRVYGSVMTETGDYRFLEGGVKNNVAQISTFDGGFLYYFRFEMGDTLLGRYYSGRSYSAPFKAYRDSSFSLADADSLTFIKEGYETLAFSFPNLKGDTLNLDDQKYAGKPVIVQIMGSWCPNCLDESLYLKDQFEKYHEQGLEVVGLTFERARNYETALKRAKKMERDLKLPYPILLAGATRKDNAAELLPMLNHIMSYPTSIYLNKNHKVVKIHTGFAGPGTPLYEDFLAENDKFIQALIN
jgi:thiol-disulfide isomerase/thioredoxin